MSCFVDEELVVRAAVRAQSAHSRHCLYCRDYFLWSLAMVIGRSIPMCPVTCRIAIEVFALVCASACSLLAAGRNTRALRPRNSRMRADAHRSECDDACTLRIHSETSCESGESLGPWRCLRLCFRCRSNRCDAPRRAFLEPCCRRAGDSRRSPFPVERAELLIPVSAPFPAVGIRDS